MDVVDAERQVRQPDFGGVRLKLHPGRMGESGAQFGFPAFRACRVDNHFTVAEREKRGAMERSVSVNAIPTGGNHGRRGPPPIPRRPCLRCSTPPNQGRASISAARAALQSPSRRRGLLRSASAGGARKITADANRLVARSPSAVVLRVLWPGWPTWFASSSARWNWIRDGVRLSYVREPDFR